MGKTKNKMKVLNLLSIIALLLISSSYQKKLFKAQAQELIQEEYYVSAHKLKHWSKVLHNSPAAHDVVENGCLDRFLKLALMMHKNTEKKILSTVRNWCH